MEKPNRNLPPPPQLMLHGEELPVIKPPLRDLPPPKVRGHVEELEPFANQQPASQLKADLTAKAQEAALANESVMQALAGKRYIPIGASLLTDRNNPKTDSLMYVFYNYTDNLSIEVYFDQSTQGITHVAQERYQPAPLKREIEQAILLARNDSRLSGLITDDLEGTAILVSPIDPDDPNCYHRQFDIRFGCPDERLPRYMALVDMSTESVLKVGSLCGKNQSTGSRGEI